MSREWTEQQQKAIQTRHKSLLVAAAAGSGKTAVLVERIITMLTDPDSQISLDRLLIVTFTNAAAAEMRERISAALQEALAANPQSERLYQQSLLVNKAQITTLHSFCLELVRNYFYLLDIPPSLKIMDDIEGRLLKQDVLEEVFERYYADEEKGVAFAQLADQLGGKEDEGLQTIILRLYEQSMSMSKPREWLEQLADKLLKTDWIGLYLPYVKGLLTQARHYMEQALTLAHQGEGLERYAESFAEEASSFATLAKAAEDGWDALNGQIMTLGNFFKRLPVLKKETIDEEAKIAAAAAREKAKGLYKQLEATLSGRTEQDLLADLALIYPQVQLLAEVTLAFIAAYRAQKQEKELMDFDDMEHYCLQLLYETNAEGLSIPTELSRTLQNYYQEVMVDEYQDINDLQESILQGVSRSDNLFMVGDIKQSIYGFRMANPRLFLSKYDTFPLENQAEENTLRIDLNRNFRCRKPIIDAVNTIFVRLMTGEGGDLRYDERAALVHGAYYPPKAEDGSNQVDVILIDTTTEEETDASGQLSAIELETQAVGRYIQEMFARGEQVYDTKLNAYRPLRYSDIVLLMRSPKASAQSIQKQLEQAGIPVYAGYGEGYFDAWEVQIILALLQVLDNPLQDIPLAAVLRSPFAGFSDSDLLTIRLQDENGNLYHCLQLAAGSDLAQPLKEKMQTFLQKLSSWRELARQKETSSLIWQLYRETHFYDYVGALAGGSQRQANLRALHEKARLYEQTSFSGLFSFLKFIEQMKQQDQDLEPAKVLSENTDVVRLFSIHKSKGLEFPVVFLLGMGKSFNLRDTKQDVVIDRDYGLGLPVILPEAHLKYPTIAQLFIKQHLKQQALTEEKRILYVALTRAREKLILLGSVKNLAKRYDECQEAKASNSYLDWLLPIIKEQCSVGVWRLQQYSEADLHMITAPKCSPFLDEAALQALAPLVALDDSKENIIAQKLSWQYPDPYSAQIRSKVTVTELKRLAQDNHTQRQVDIFRRPLCMAEQKGPSPAEKGTLLHLLMRHIDVSCTINESYLVQLAHRLEAESFIAAGQIEKDDLDKVLVFFQSDLGKRMQKAKTLYRELPFTLALDSHILQPNALAETKPVLLQGIIDGLWWEEDGWVLVDYKNDYLLPQDVAHFALKHQEQVQLYAQAVERIWRKPVKACYLYMFTLGQYVDVPAQILQGSDILPDF